MTSVSNRLDAKEKITMLIQRVNSIGNPWKMVLPLYCEYGVKWFLEASKQRTFWKLRAYKKRGVSNETRKLSA